MNDPKTATPGASPSPDSRADIELIGDTLTRMRVMIGRRIIGRLAIRNVAPDLDLSHLDVVDAVRHVSLNGEATVGAIAEAMRIDPSRGSRVVADMVDRGVLARAVSQADARRAVVVLTPLGISILEEIHAVKRTVVETIVSDWPAGDIAEFGRLFDRFVSGFQTVARLPEKECAGKGG
ncbi:winged helix-turn-helix transcriptional regulator [Rhizobium sp. CG5]|uniref:MarR family winged helix-turn-helix transcriptional regulator n=1 Tax=Rhizobium sp. CG5 TaxID=2726076 RepID=UPI00203454DF|nr:MarR family winged helix-turn-helix transcriptional regulator [Rhizobium sp. CG5]MCM2476541.1 winged helix-turn-helix transcriptional regulator [Rhizobium sp. CG5]